MVRDKKEEDFENGLIDPKTVELDTKFREAMDGKKSIKTSLEIIWESMNYNFGKIRTRQHMNTQATQKMVFEQKILEHKFEEISVKQLEFRPKVESHMECAVKDKIKTEATWSVITKTLGAIGILITITLALLQLITILGVN
jgi:hypothetical protein